MVKVWGVVALLCVSMLAAGMSVASEHCPGESCSRPPAHAGQGNHTHPGQGPPGGDDAPPWYPNDGDAEMTFIEVESVGGHMVPVTVYRPVIADADTQMPVLLQSHGFTGSRATSVDAFRDYIAAGFGVVSFDERGHGDARDDSEVHFMHPEYEVQDVLAVIDEIASWDWVLMEDAEARDPVLGTIGYSYGGAFQLMGAVFDDRIDAMVPEITWNDITRALAPNGAVKSGWVDLFYIAGNAQRSVTFGEEFHRGWVYANAANEFPAGQLPGVPDLYTQMKSASPGEYPGQITVPTLLVQGMSDTLFPLNEAAANYEQIQATGAEVALYTHLGGHVLNLQSLASDDAPAQAGLQGVPGGRPCGDQTSLDIAWHQTHLLGLDAWQGPRVCIALEDETVLTGDDFPLPQAEAQAFDLGGPWPVPQSAGVSIPIEVPADGTLAGIPTLEGTITTPSPDTILYFSLRIPGRDQPYETYVNDQVMPLRLEGPLVGEPFSLDLAGVGTDLAGQSLELHISPLEPMYFANGSRVPAGVVLEDLEITLPLVA